VLLEFFGIQEEIPKNSLNQKGIWTFLLGFDDVLGPLTKTHLNCYKVIASCTLFWLPDWPITCWIGYNFYIPDWTIRKVKTIITTLLILTSLAIALDAQSKSPI